MKTRRLFFSSLRHRFLILIAFLFSIVLVSCSSTEQKQDVSVKSPDGNYILNFNINESWSPLYSVKYKGAEIVGASGLGFELSGDTGKANAIQIESVETNSVDSSWKPIYGEKNEYPDAYEESLIVLSGEGARYNLRVRAYNEGIAFRYEFKEHTKESQEDGKNIRIQKELTEFALPPNADAWTSVRAQSEITKIKLSEIDTVMERPLLVQLPDSMFVALGEAALVDYARMKFVNKEGSPGTLTADLASEVTGDATLQTPWRFIMAADTPGQLLEQNYLLLNLNETNQIADTSWIKPGKVIRESTLTTRGGIACVDFAAKHQLEYIEFDAGWYGNEYDDASDATTVTIDPKRSKGPLDLPKVIEYAKSKDIGVILYVNRRSLEKQLDEVLPLLQSWGVSGIKYGFVNVGPQEWTSWLHDAVRKAADHKLMIDTHDEYRPTGYSRTYPNFMTQEGIRGDEESPENFMVLNTLFTRMLAGAGDQTNCYFAPRVTEKMGSHASQLAKSVLIYSPWQFLYWYDRPEGSQPEGEGAGGSREFIQEVPELAFYDVLPTVWDDTKVIDGYPGEFAVIARRSGDDWFIGGLNGDVERNIDIAMDFLSEGKNYEATIYSDDDSLNTSTNVSVETVSLTADDVFGHSLKAKNGVALHIRALD